MHIYLSTNHLVTYLFQFLSIKFLCSFISHCYRASSCDPKPHPWRIIQGWLNSSCWDSPVTLDCRSPCSSCLLSSTSSVWLETWGWLFWSSWTLVFTFPCTFSLVTCLWWTFVILQLSLPRWWLSCLWETRSSPTMHVLLRCSFLYSLPLWKISSWHQWLMIAMQPCANPYTTRPPWRPVCVLVWPQAPMSTAFWMPLFTSGTHSVSLSVGPI